MTTRTVLAAIPLSVALVTSAYAEDALINFKSLSPSLALELARAALADCEKRGYQVTVAVVDRFGVPQVLLRDRFAGAHTPSTATGKAWTAVSFRTNTKELGAVTREGTAQSAVRQLPGVVAVGGGMMIEAGGAVVGGIGVSGGPGGDADEECAKAGIEAVRDKLEF